MAGALRGRLIRVLCFTVRPLWTDGAFEEERGEEMGGGFEGGAVEADDDAGGIEVVVQGLALAQELGAEEEPAGGELVLKAAGVADRDGGLDDHDGSGVHLEDEADDFFDVGGVEEVLDGVVVGGGCDDDEIGIAVGRGAVEGGREVQVFLGKIFLDVIILYGRFLPVDLLYFFGYDVHGHYLLVLSQEGGDAESYVACSGDCYYHIRVA